MKLVICDKCNEPIKEIKWKHLTAQVFSAIEDSLLKERYGGSDLLLTTVELDYHERCYEEIKKVLIKK